LSNYRKVFFVLYATQLLSHHTAVNHRQRRELQQLHRHHHHHHVTLRYVTSRPCVNIIIISTRRQSSYFTTYSVSSTVHTSPTLLANNTTDAWYTESIPTCVRYAECIMSRRCWWEC